MLQHVTGVLEVLWAFQRIVETPWLSDIVKKVFVRELLEALPTPKHAMAARDSHEIIANMLKAYLNGTAEVSLGKGDTEAAEAEGPTKVQEPEPQRSSVPQEPREPTSKGRTPRSRVETRA